MPANGCSTARHFRTARNTLRSACQPSHLRRCIVIPNEGNMPPTTLKFHDHFSAVANRYAGFRPHYPAALFEYLATLVPRNSTVWDCACGNGQAAIDLANRFEHVIGTDA